MAPEEITLDVLRDIAANATEVREGDRERLTEQQIGRAHV